MRRSWARAAAASALLGVLGLAGAAAAMHREDDVYDRKRVGAGEIVSRTLGCRSGDLTGGGYQLTGLPDDAAPFVVTASYPLADGRWRVDLRNVGRESRPLTLRIYVLCTD